MAELIPLVEAYGLPLFFAVGFVEFIGLPLASVPILVAGGALARLSPELNPLLLVPATAAGGLLADAILYALVRWKGTATVSAACGLTSNPAGCVLKVEERVRSLGTGFIMGAKFVPGAGNLIGPASALAGTRTLRFLAADGAALLAWAGVYTAVGWIFRHQVEEILALILGSLGWVLPGALVLAGLAGLWRYWRVHSHTRLHRERKAGAVSGTAEAA